MTSEPRNLHPGVAVETFDHPEYFGAFAAEVFPRGIHHELARVTDLKAAEKTLHWGRNYLYVVELGSQAASAVVKMFPHHGWRARLRRRWSGSRAEKSWESALLLGRAGVATPRPFAWIESKAPHGPSFYICEQLADYFEIRYLFRALAAGTEVSEFPSIDIDDLFRELGRAIRQLHDSGFWHRDLTVGNVLVRERSPAQPGDSDRFEFNLVDLNRGRQGRTLSLRQRCQDLGRLPMLRSSLQEIFLTSYWGAPPSRWQRLMYRAHLHGFLWKNQFKRLARAPLRKTMGLLQGRGTHAHIPPPPEGAGARERVVWDELSDQPHLHATPASKTLTRLRDAPIHLRSGVAALVALPRAWRRFKTLEKELYRRPFELPSIGLAVSPDASRSDELIAALDELGVRRLLVRLPLWHDSLAPELDLCRRLSRPGRDIAFTLAQNRDLVRDRSRWRHALERVAEDFVPLGENFQVGQAINRSKWGVWNYREYLELAAEAASVLKTANPEARILGPSVIDFEYHATLAALNLGSPQVHFDAVASLLYVDRRGAPEARQLGLDTVGKITLLKAIAETAQHAGGESWITEFNWPLWEGPHSPAGKDVSVDEESQANYLARYFLLALTSGYVSRVYWWQLAARGYGLMDRRDGEPLRRRPSFHAMRTLVQLFDGASFVRRLAVSDDLRLFELSRDGDHWVAAWHVSGKATVTLPDAAVEVVERDGHREPLGPTDRVEVSQAPRYFRTIR